MHATTLAIEVLLPDEPLAVDLPHVYAQLHRLPDQRARRCVRYPRPMLLVVAILAKLAGLHQVRALEHLLQQSLHPSNPEVPNRAQIALALDGKTLRGTIPLGHTGRPSRRCLCAGAQRDAHPSAGGDEGERDYGRTHHSAASRFDRVEARFRFSCT